MRWRAALAATLLVAVAAAVLFVALQRALAGTWLALGVHPEVLAVLERSLESERRLARLEPEREAEHRARFAATQRLLQNLRVLERSRAALERRFAQLLAVAAAAAALAAVALVVARQSRRERRMLERDRRRLEALRQLSAWQEAARRHAHEMRTPLTAARLELARLQEIAATGDAAELRATAASAVQELERLQAFIRGFTSFARLPRPRPRREDLGALVGFLADTFAAAWPGVALVAAAPPAPVVAWVDRDLLRQVLVNLCDNAAQAIGDGSGTVTLTVAAAGDVARVDVADDGPGVAPEVRERLFEPYATTRDVGRGMGLGLAISRKVLLDHGGDLELHATSAAGTTFRLTLPATPPAAPDPATDPDRRTALP